MRIGDEFAERLERLEAVWRRLDAPVLRYLRPGLPEERIEDLLAPTGLVLPEELRLWWAWHDGADDPSVDVDDNREIGPGGWLHLPLHEAVALHEHRLGAYRGLLAMGAPDAAALEWRPGLFPFSHRVAKHNHVLAVDASVGVHAPAPVTMTSEMGIETHCGAASVTAMLDIWIELLESGRYRLLDGFFETDPPGLVEEDERLRWPL